MDNVRLDDNETMDAIIRSSYEDQTMGVAKVIIDATEKSKWFDEEPYYHGTKELFENDPKELISSQYTIWTNASRKKVLDRFLELLTSINATYDEPDISYEEKYRTKTIYDNGGGDRLIQPIPYNAFEDATINVNLGGFPTVRVMIVYDPKKPSYINAHKLDVFVSLMNYGKVA